LSGQLLKPRLCRGIVTRGRSYPFTRSNPVDDLVDEDDDDVGLQSTPQKWQRLREQDRENGKTLRDYRGDRI
jgi:hypothetical protein